MIEHTFKLGQMVVMNQALPDRSTSRLFEITRLMPASVDGELHYRVRGSDKIERAVRESSLVLARGR